MNFKSADEVLDFAIKEEGEAVEFYTNLASQMSNQWIKKVFEGFAREEAGHKHKLEEFKSGKVLVHAEEKIMDLKIADYLVDVTVTPNLSYQDALIVAMQKEKSAFKLYSDLAATTDDAGLSEVLLGLAQEEAKHKLRFEVEYDELVMVEN